MSDPRNEEKDEAFSQRVKDLENEYWNDSGTVQEAIAENISVDIVTQLKAARNSTGTAQLALFAAMGKQLLEDTGAYIEGEATKIIERDEK